jgi:predicted outer membrane protein
MAKSKTATRRFLPAALGVPALLLSLLAHGQSGAVLAAQAAPAAGRQAMPANPNQTTGARGSTAAAATGSGTPQSNNHLLVSDPTNQVGGSGGSASAGSSLSLGDQQFIKQMAVANMAEVDMGKMALSKSSNEEVKRYAQQMIDDHGQALGDVQALAQAKNVTLPGSLDAVHNAEAAKLNGMSGAAFDRAYMARGGVRDHKKTVAKLRGIEQRAKDADVKAAAGKMLPVVEQHLRAAEQIAGTMGKAAMPPEVGGANAHEQGKPTH